METFKWHTYEPHANNEETMCEFIENHLDEYCGYDCKVIIYDGTYVEIEVSNGNKYALHASGDGDCYNHKIEFERIN